MEETESNSGYREKKLIHAPMEQWEGSEFSFNFGNDSRKARKKKKYDLVLQ